MLCCSWELQDHMLQMVGPAGLLRHPQERVEARIAEALIPRRCLCDDISFRAVGELQTVFPFHAGTSSYNPSQSCISSDRGLRPVLGEAL